MGKEKFAIPKELESYDYRKNLIVDQNNPILIQKAWRDRFSGESHWRKGKGGKAYLSRDNSEDALTWNVFRSLEKSGKEGLSLISNIFRISQVDKILFWGCDVKHKGEEQQLLNILIRIIDGQLRGTMTEPNLVLITDKEVVFVECKLNQNVNTSPWKAQREGAEKRWRTYVGKADEIKNYVDNNIFPELEEINNWRDVYQLIRQYVYASSMSKYLGKKAIVIPLINGKHKEILSKYYSILKDSEINKDGIFRDFVTWQDILESLSGSNLLNKERIIKKIDEALFSVK